LSARIRETARATGFRPDKPVIEVRGRCGDCAQALLSLAPEFIDTGAPTG